VQDITDAKTRKSELEQARQEVEVLVEAKDQLFFIIGHDLKSPFNNIIGFASLLSGSAIAVSPEKVQEYASHILEAAENTNALLDTLLAWAAVESADLPFRPTEITLAEAFDDIVRPPRTLAREKGVIIETAFNETRVKADRDMVLTVFRNLINNAIKFCEAGDQISVSAQPHEESPDDVHVTVTDTGIGMVPKKFAHSLRRNASKQRQEQVVKQGPGWVSAFAIIWCAVRVATYGWNRVWERAAAFTSFCRTPDTFLKIKWRECRCD